MFGCGFGQDQNELTAERFDTDLLGISWRRRSGRPLALARFLESPRLRTESVSTFSRPDGNGIEVVPMPSSQAHALPYIRSFR